MVIVDTDVHNGMKSNRDLLPYLPKEWHDEWLEMDLGIAWQYYPVVVGSRKDAMTDEGGSPVSDPQFMLKHLIEPYGIDYANALASAWNDWMIEHGVNVSPVFKGSILINNTDPQAAASEIDRMASHPGMVQIIMTSASRMLYGQRFYHAIYEAAERNGIPVGIQPGGEGRGISPAVTNAGYPTRYFEWHNVLPISYIAHLNSLVCEGVFNPEHI